MHAMSRYLEIEGGATLQGEVSIPGAKNAALPMLCAALLTPEPCRFHRVPNIGDITRLLDIFRSMGIKVTHDKAQATVEIEAKEIDISGLADNKDVTKLRATILLLGPLLARLGQVELPLPGGCIIGARSNSIHLDGFRALGIDVQEREKSLLLTRKSTDIPHKRLLLTQASVTGTENLSIFLASQPEPIEIFFAAAEPHVCATLRMLADMGADIQGIGTHHLTITGRTSLHGVECTIPPDNLLVGTYAIAGILTGGALRIGPVYHPELYSFYGALRQIGVDFEMLDDALILRPSQNLTAIPKIQTAIFPGFPTDLQSPMGVLLTQCEGESLIFETLFENRLTYLSELEKMGADVQILNAHQARVQGKTPLKAAEVQSWDLRAGAAMVLAGLVAEGKTRVTNVQYIDRGYEHFPETLTSLGASIRRVEV